MSTLSGSLPNVSNANRKRDNYITNLKTKLRTNVRTITENFELILQRSKVHACENLTRLVSELKQVLIIGDFCWLEESKKNGSLCRKQKAHHLKTVSNRIKKFLISDIAAIENELSSSHLYNTSE